MKDSAEMASSSGDRTSQAKPPLRDFCPICTGASRRLFKKHGFWIRDCLECSHRFAEIMATQEHVEQVYVDGYFKGDGAGYPDYLAEEELLISHAKRYARILNRYMSPGNVLEIGAAAGFILKGFEEMGWKGQGIEPNLEMAEYARGRLGVNVEANTLEDSQLVGRYDLISMIQVIAHFLDPRRALQVAVRRTEPGGYWLIETWNKESWTARILGKSWHEYSPPSVLHWFSPESLRQLVSEFGLREVARGRPTKWIRPSHAKSIGQNELAHTAFGGLIRVMTSLIPERLSLPYVADDLFWALYKSPEADLPQ